ncbi:hypothetical protein JJL45_06790 [Tamlana sp. s12]|uniref:hypothetical protein n=1 Tax=Tamlana sp. s12 TaxID=1630406 RepID=UPI0007FE21F7|nr:hypothetical protein [Tamlana sp. s12]OBQ55822.1 hypothetical protein VQ01_05300 [Tamlana sp. s12]QQY83690.1 hypothetical protein JJL45_06790 [Tamlana sp. s12]
MKNIFIISCLALLCLACKKELTPQDIAQNIADAHGFENWSQVSEIQFTFNVDKDSMHFERAWKWNPNTNEITHYKRRDSIQYNGSKIDSTLAQTDRGFINDKFWLLIPFQLVWDSDITFSEVTKTEAPINKKQLNKLTITYPNKGGYTPGDAYDIFYDDDYLIREWIFRKANQEEPSMMTTFENYQDFNGLKLALEHKKPEDSWRLYFSDVNVVTK